MKFIQKVQKKYIRADFMKPETYQDTAYVVDTQQGISIVPADLVGDLGLKLGDYIEKDDPRFDKAKKALEDLVDGTEFNSIEMKRGWLARMSAPGYLDATEWGLYDTEKEAKDDLKQMYQED